MNIKIFYVISSVCIGLLIASGLVDIYNLPSHPTFERSNNVIPNFNLENLNGTIYNNCDLPVNGKPIILMNIDPSCPDCNTMMAKILKFCNEFEETNLILIAQGDKSQIQYFIDFHGIKAHDYIKTLYDPYDVMIKNYDLIEVPSFIIYNDKLELITILKDTYTFPVLISYVRQSIEKKSR